MENGINENKISGGLTVIIILSIIQTISVITMCVMCFLMYGKINNLDSNLAPITEYYNEAQGYYENYDVYTDESYNDYVEENIEAVNEGEETNIEETNVEEIESAEDGQN